MPLREMKWRPSRSLTFQTQRSKAQSGLNPGTRLTASPRDGELKLGWERSPGLRGLSGRLAVWGLGSLLITPVLKCPQAAVGLAPSWWLLKLLFLPWELSALSSGFLSPVVSETESKPPICCLCPCPGQHVSTIESKFKPEFNFFLNFSLEAKYRGSKQIKWHAHSYQNMPLYF